MTKGSLSLLPPSTHYVPVNLLVSPPESVHPTTIQALGRSALRFRRRRALRCVLREEILEEVGHAQWVFTIPKPPRPYFLYHRVLLGKLSQAAWETVHELIAEAAGDARDLRPGMVSVEQTATDLLEWSPQIHRLVSRGGWRRDGTWVPVPDVDANAAELLFRHKVIGFLRDDALLSQERIDLLLSWQNNVFSVHNAVTVAALG